MPARPSGTDGQSRESRDRSRLEQRGSSQAHTSLSVRRLLPCPYHDTIVPMSRTPIVSLAALSLACSVMAQAPASGQRVHRLLIHNAIVIDGNGTPASGPKDIVIENNLIADVIPLDAVAAARGSGTPARAGADAVIDATGKLMARVKEIVAEARKR